MTIYIVKYKEDHKNGMPPLIHYHAASSFIKAKEKINEIIEIPSFEIITDITGDQIQKWQPKNQADVINLINNLYGREEF